MADAERLVSAPAVDPLRRRFARRHVVALSFVVLPWGWFLVRGLSFLQGAAVVLPLLSVGGALFSVAVAIGRRRAVALLVSLSFMVFGVYMTIEPRRPIHGPEPAAAIRVVSANVYDGNPTPQDALDSLLNLQADITIGVETSDAFQELMATDMATPQYRTGVDQLVLVSKYPVHLEPTPSALPDKRVMVVTVDTPSGPLTVFVLHALNPAYETSFGSQLDFIQRLRKTALLTGTPTLIIGDFNLSDRGQGYRDMTGAFRDAMRAGSWAEDTFAGGLWRILLLRIDHAFLSPSWCAADSATFDVPGSDHEGLTTNIGPCALTK